MNAESSPKQPPRERLRSERERRGWSQDEVADRLCALAASRGEAALGVGGYMVGRWERGFRNPNPQYARLLSVLFELPAEELDLSAKCLAGDRRAELSQLHGASAELETASKVQVCVCPCDSAGHRSTCSVSIKPGQEMWTAQLDGYGPRRAVICGPCWTAINGESGQ